MYMITDSLTCRPQKKIPAGTGGVSQLLARVTTTRPRPRVTKALAKASITMAKVDLWHARLAVKTLRRDQREAIAGASED